MRIVGTDLPGGDGVTVGVQRGQVTVFEVPATAAEARFEFELERPFIHGRSPERCIYLVWRRDGQMFRRAKLMLPALDGSLVEARLGMTDARGGPVCAAVRPPKITWTVLD